MDELDVVGLGSVRLSMLRAEAAAARARRANDSFMLDDDDDQGRVIGMESRSRWGVRSRLKYATMVTEGP